MKDIKFREPLFNDNVFYKFHYWGCWDGYFIKPISSLPEKSQEYTGLKDKSCKEIYEGDVISFNRGYVDDSQADFWQGNNYLIEFIKGKFYPVNYPKRYYLSFDGANDETMICKNFEIIGNIYETPELLTPPRPIEGG